MLAPVDLPPTGVHYAKSRTPPWITIACQPHANFFMGYLVDEGEWVGPHVTTDSTKVTCKPCLDELAKATERDVEGWQDAKIGAWSK